MKHTFKVLGTQSRVLCAIALVAIIGLSMAACGGDGGGSNKILGLPYSLKFDHQDYSGGELTSYILDCTYAEAFEILTQKFGRWRHQVDAQGIDDTFPANIVFLDYIHANPDWVALQDCVDMGRYFLVHKYRPDDPNDLLTDGRSWDKPLEQEGSIKISGMPERYDGKIAIITVIEFLNGVVDMRNNWWNLVPHRLAFQGGGFAESNGSVDLSLEWFPSKRYDRKSGTYKHGEAYTIFLYIDNVVPRKIPVITFTNGRAELDFNAFEKAPEAISDPESLPPDFEW